MFVGETGMAASSADLRGLRAADIEDPEKIEQVRALGVIDLPDHQEELNLHYWLSLDCSALRSPPMRRCVNASLRGVP